MLTVYIRYTLYTHVLGESNPKFLELVLNPVVNIFTIKYVQTKPTIPQRIATID
jgi:hypothetical protein